MSLLFDDERVPVDAIFSVKATSSFPGSEQVLVGRQLWESLIPHPETRRLCISIASTSDDSRFQHPHKTLICWAARDEQATDEVVISEELNITYKHIFRNPRVSIIPTTPLLLSEIIISALSPEAFQASSVQQENLERQLCGSQTILRQGSVCSVNLKDGMVNGIDHSKLQQLRFRLDMLEPVLQGYAEPGKTRFIVVPSFIGGDDAVSDSTMADDLESNSDSEVVEIDEGFLGNSITQFNFNPISPSPDASSRNGTAPNATEVTLEAVPLDHPVSLHYDDHTLYLRTADLSRVGLLDGDWAVANTISKCRLVRVVASDSIVPSTGIVKGSPTLIHNLNPEHSADPTRVSLRPSPFGSSAPTVPTAVSVTIARVASPLTITRTYQTLFLKALKRYFEGRKHLVKEGDLIVIGLDTDEILRNQDSESEEQDRSEETPIFETRNNGVVFFMITNVEYDTISKGKEPVHMDAYFGSTTGELGYWLDPSQTRMVQAGLEQTRVPDVYTYFGLGQPVHHPDGLLPSKMPQKPLEKLYSFVSVITEPSGADYNLQLSVLLKGSRGVGKFTVTSAVARLAGLHLLEVNCYDIISENDTKTEALMQTRFENAAACAPCILVLRHLEAFAQSTQTPESGKEPVLVSALRECIANAHSTWKISGHPVIVCGMSSQVDRVPTSLLSCFKHEISFEAPDEQERAMILHELLDRVVISPDVSMSALAQQTAAFLAGDLSDLVRRAEAASILRVLSSTPGADERSVRLAGVSLTNADFDKALGLARASYSESIGAPKIPSVSWDDVGGLAQVKSDIMDTIQLPLDHPELFSDGLKKRSGILLYGPPGTGKTLIAKAVATSFSLNFFSVKGPELLNMYIGESEANVRRVFQRARDAKPCVVFFDELDSIAPKRGNQGDSGGVMDRIVSQLLAELDGTSGGSASADVFVIGATNRPDLLDPALLRPGRFDRMLYLGVSQTHEAQVNILEALTRKFILDPQLDLHKVAQGCTFNYTGADFYALCADALLNAMSRKAEELEEKITEINKQPPSHQHPHPLTPQYYLAEMATPEEILVTVTQEDFDRALRNLVPSVSQAEMNHYARIQSRFSKDQSGAGGAD